MSPGCNLGRFDPTLNLFCVVEPQPKPGAESYGPRFSSGPVQVRAGSDRVEAFHAYEPAKCKPLVELSTRRGSIGDKVVHELLLSGDSAQKNPLSMFPVSPLYVDIVAARSEYDVHSSDAVHDPKHVEDSLFYAHSALGYVHHYTSSFCFH
ncbi:hypothetical protein ACLOJK_025370 [Asimina triloba]